MATAYKNSNLVEAGVGTIYVAPLGTAEPTNASSSLASGWREVGYTDAGSKITSEKTVEEIEVAEEDSPIKTVQTKLTAKLSFEMAQATASNLALALNLGADISDTVSSVAPPATGDDVSVMLCLDTNQGARWLFHSGKNGANLELQRVKNGKTLVGVEFNIEKVTGKNLFDVFPGEDGLI